MHSLTDAIRHSVVSEYAQNPDQAIEDSPPLMSCGTADAFSLVSRRRFLERPCASSIPDRVATTGAFDTVERIADLVRQPQRTA